MTQPTSIKFTKEELSNIDTECEGLGCTRTAFIKEAVKEKLEEKDRQDQDVAKEPKTDNSQTESQDKPISEAKVTAISNDGGKTWTKLDNSNKSKVAEIDSRAYRGLANSGAEVKEPQKITIKEIPQDNSQKPPVTFTQFNGKLLPFAKRYNI